MSVDGRHKQLVRHLSAVRANSWVMFTVFALLTVGILGVTIALSVTRAQQLQHSTTRLVDGEKSVAADESMPQQSSDIEMKISSSENSQSSIVNQKKIGVSVNGTPISIPKGNKSVNRVVRSNSGNGDVQVNISSQSSTANNESASSTSISVESTSEVTKEEF